MLTKEQKRRIEAEAQSAAAQGKAPNEACPYPFHSDEALHWLAAWAVAGGPKAENN